MSLNESVNANVSSEFVEEALFDWTTYSFLTFLSIGALINLLHVYILVKTRKNGTLNIMLQIAANDTSFLYVGTVEVLIISSRSWIFSSNACQLFKGTEIVSNTLLAYLIACLNFHVISLWNLHKNSLNQNPLTSKADSNECLVEKQEKANRSINIDYRKRRNDVTVLIPLTLIWFLCLSLSIPSYTLTSLKDQGNSTQCNLIDNFYGEVLNALLIIFKTLIPLPLILFSLFLLILKLSKTSQKHIDNVLTKKFCEIRSLLIFSIILTVTYLISSLYRHSEHVLYMFNVILPQNRLSLFSTMFYYIGSTARATLYYAFLPKYNELVKDKLLCGCK